MTRSIFSLVIAAAFANSPSPAGEHHAHGEAQAHAASFDYLTGRGANVGGFLFPELFVTGTGGVTESGSEVEDFANSEHDPLEDAGIQGIELHLSLDGDGAVTGAVESFVHAGGDRGWEAELEEAYLHYHLDDRVAVGGGRFLNVFGFQADRHLHGWDFVNQNLINGRMLNEGHLLTQGGELIVDFGEPGRLTVGAGGVRTHAHSHDRGAHEHEEHGQETHEEHDHEEEHRRHLTADEAGFESWVLSLDHRFRLPFDESVTATTSLAAGENGFGRDNFVYGLGVQKVWNGHEHDQGAEFCTGALMMRTEFIGREVEAREEDGEAVDFADRGFSTGLFYGVGEDSTLSLRHDWVSGVEMAELAEAHRISPAFTTFLGRRKRVRARIQYDYTQSDAIAGEHAAWLQIQVRWGGGANGHRDHRH